MAQSGRTFSLRFALVSILLPYFGGYLFSWTNFDHVERLLSPFLHSKSNNNRILQQQQDPQVLLNTVVDCYRKNFQRQVQALLGDNAPTFVMHRNGQSEPCSHASSTHNFEETLQVAIMEYVQEHEGKCPPTTKYELESLLTRYFAETVGTTACSSQESYRSSKRLGFYGYCDMGMDHTPILRDHHKLVSIQNPKVSATPLLPCHFHDAQGVRITSFKNLFAAPAADCKGDSCTTKEIHVYAVPAGRVYMHTATFVGQRIDLPHVSGGDPTLPVYLEVLSVSPAVFDLHNFFSKQESAELIARAIEERKESHRIKRSSTGDSGYHINDRRTSESGYDTDGATSMRIKYRCFDVLGFDEYLEGHADGLQILRYNLTTAYVPHMDWFATTDATDNDDYDSAKQGGNRFATILLYMSDLRPEDGGETVFTEAWPSYVPENERVSLDTALKEFRESNQTSLLKNGSWEEKMVAQCRTRLAIRPNSARAVLFYSLYVVTHKVCCANLLLFRKPNGEPDNKSMHGACPVLDNQKYAANLWVWSTPRPGYPGSPKKGKKNVVAQQERQLTEKDTVTDTSPGRVLVTFRNAGSDASLNEAKLYYVDPRTDTDSFWGTMGPNDPPVSVNSYKGHVWRVKVGDQLRKEWSIDKELPNVREFVL